MTTNAAPVTSHAHGLSLAHVWVVAAIVLPLLIVAASPLGMVDLAYHLRLGNEMLLSRVVPRADTFTFTAAGLPWLDQQWLSQVLLAGVFNGGGWFGLALMRSLLAAVALAAIFAACRASGAEARMSAWLTMASAALLLPTLQLRPQLFGVACFAIALWLLAARHMYPRRLWLLVPLVALWSNLHGTFFLAIGLIGLAWLHDVRAQAPHRHRLVAIGLTVIAATMLTPYGPMLWAYVWRLSSNPAVRGLVMEWQPTAFDSYSGAAFLTSIPIVVLLLLQRRAEVSWPMVLSLSSFLLIGLASVRGVYWWAMAAPVLLAGTSIGRAPSNRTDPPRRANLAIAAVLVSLSLLAIGAWLPYRATTSVPAGRLSEAPFGITASLQRELARGERVFAAQAWGSWLEFALPEHPVAVDSRIELFPAAVWAQYAQLSAGQEGWSRLLEAWQVRVVAVHARQQPILMERLATDVRWRAVHRDADGAVFVRR